MGPRTPKASRRGGRQRTDLCSFSRSHTGEVSRPPHPVHVKRWFAYNHHHGPASFLPSTSTPPLIQQSNHAIIPSSTPLPAWRAKHETAAGAPDTADPEVIDVSEYHPPRILNPGVSVSYDSPRNLGTPGAAEDVFSGVSGKKIPIGKERVILPLIVYHPVKQVGYGVEVLCARSTTERGTSCGRGTR